MLEPEAVIVSLNTDLYAMKCQVLLLSIENAALRAKLAGIENAILAPVKAMGATA
jgi:hypothetical protein